MMILYFLTVFLWLQPAQQDKVLTNDQLKSLFPDLTWGDRVKKARIRLAKTGARRVEPFTFFEDALNRRQYRQLYHYYVNDRDMTKKSWQQDDFRFDLFQKSHALILAVYHKRKLQALVLLSPNAVETLRSQASSALSLPHEFHKQATPPIDPPRVDDVTVFTPRANRPLQQEPQGDPPRSTEFFSEPDQNHVAGGGPHQIATKLIPEHETPPGNGVPVPVGTRAESRVPSRQTVVIPNNDKKSNRVAYPAAPPLIADEPAAPPNTEKNLALLLGLAAFAGIFIGWVGQKRFARAQWQNQAVLHQEALQNQAFQEYQGEVDRLRYELREALEEYNLAQQENQMLHVHISVLEQEKMDLVQTLQALRFQQRQAAEGKDHFLHRLHSLFSRCQNLNQDHAKKCKRAFKIALHPDPYPEPLKDEAKALFQEITADM